MCPNQNQQFNVLSQKVYHTKRNELLSQFRKEQKKLEDMVVARFADGKSNLGADVSILKQSVIIDRLVVDGMKLDELLARHRSDQHLE